MLRSRLTLLSVALALSAPALFLSNTAHAESGFASSVTGFFKNIRNDADSKSGKHQTITPPSELTSSSGNRNGRIVLAQSKRELGAAIQGNTRAIGENALRVQDLQEQMRQITGRVEQLVFELQRVQEQLRIMQEDASLGGDDATTQHADSSGENDDPESGGNQDANLLPHDTGPSFGNDQPVIALGAPLDLRAAAQEAPAAQPAGETPNSLPAVESGDPLLQPNGTPSLGTLTVSPTSDPDGLYNLGYTQLLNGDYDAAEGNLREFVKSYPNHTLAPNGRYWLAETFYARGKYADAVEAFSGTYKAFPRSNKAPDSLLKLGLSLARLEEFDAACATLAEVFNRFPDASLSIHIAARDEQSRSNCT